MEVSAKLPLLLQVVARLLTVGWSVDCLFFGLFFFEAKIWKVLIQKPENALVCHHLYAQFVLFDAIKLPNLRNI